MLPGLKWFFIWEKKKKKRLIFKVNSQQRRLNIESDSASFLSVMTIIPNFKSLLKPGRIFLLPLKTLFRDQASCPQCQGGDKLMLIYASMCKFIFRILCWERREFICINFLCEYHQSSFCEGWPPKALMLNFLKKLKKVAKFLQSEL